MLQPVSFRGKYTLTNTAHLRGQSQQSKSQDISLGKCHVVETAARDVARECPEVSVRVIYRDIPASFQVDFERGKRPKQTAQKAQEGVIEVVIAPKSFAPHTVGESLQKVRGERDLLVLQQADDLYRQKLEQHLRAAGLEKPRIQFDPHPLSQRLAQDIGLVYS